MERQYIGARYVPIFFENPNTGDSAWLTGVAYEALTIVTFAGNSYTSKKPVPASVGSPNLNPEYWVSTGNFNAQVEELRTELENDIADVNDELSNTVKNRLVGKKIAIYGDSWTASNWGTPWLNRLNELTHAAELHSVGLGSAGLAQIYSNCWDKYNADIYIIAGGLNDVGLNTGADDFMDAIQNFVTAIRTVNTDAEIYFITPPKIDRQDFLRKKLPPDFYRTCIWRLANQNKYHVINGLKWVDIKFADGVHPTAETAPIIGDYIFSSLLSFGDEETHLDEICSMGREDYQILMRIMGGTVYIVFQSTVFSPLAADGSSGIPIDIGTNFGYSQACFFGKGNQEGAKNKPIRIVTGVYTVNQIIASDADLVGTGATSITLFSNAFMLVPISRWQTPVSA